MATTPQSLLTGGQCYTCFGASVEDTIELQLLKTIAGGSTPPPQTPNALTFDGATDSVMVPGTVMPHALTVMAWIIYTGGVDSFRNICNKSDGVEWSFSLQLGDAGLSNALDFWVDVTGGVGGPLEGIQSNTNFDAANLGKLFHVCGTYDNVSGNFNVYVNGIPDGAGPGGGGDVWTGFEAVRIGAFNGFGGNNDMFPGQIGGLRIYDKEFSAAEVLQAFNDGFGPPSNVGNLLVYYPFSEGTIGTSAVGAAIPDHSGNGNNGTGAGNAGTLLRSHMGP